MTEQRFEQLLQEMREETASPEQIQAARDRVWERLAGAASLACAGLRPELGDYLAGHLTASRRLLIEDHIGRCHHCRRVLSELKGQHEVLAIPQFQVRPWVGWTRWAVAAGLVLGALYLGRNRLDSALAPSGPRATVVSVTGAAYRVHDPTSETALPAGASLLEGEVIRTAAGSRAILQLPDGSRVEMNQRSELAVQAAWSGRTIRLDRGDVIVTAAKQRRGTLRVVTRDSVASVKGTIFAVSSGAAGSLVAVVQGSVAVAQPGSKLVLTSGQQASTNRALADVPVRQAISWSQDAEKYYALLAEFIQIEKQLVDTAPGLRTEARLLRYLPVGVEAYFAIPNLTGTIRQALYLVDQRAQESAVLNEWWSSERGQELKQTLDRMQAITPLLGEEVVMVLVKDRVAAGRKIPLVLAQIQPGRQDALRQALDRLAGDQRNGAIPYQILRTDLLLVSESASDLAAIAAQLGAGAGSPFASEITRRYQTGVSWLAALDVPALASDIQRSEPGRVLGMANMRYLFFEQRWGRVRDENELTLSFQGARTGVSSWLAPPGSAGSAEYVSSEAVVVISASTRDPRQAFEELLTGQPGELAGDLRKFESETGIQVAADIAAALGADFTFAVERPSLPIPGWVAALEVVRPALLDGTIRRLVDEFNRRLAPEDAGQKITLTRETVNGRAWSSLQARSNALHWTYDRGYLIASSDRALAGRAIAVRQSGAPLVRSAAFLDRFPSAGGIHHSGFLWLNTSGLLADLAPLVQSPALRGLLASRDPILIVMDGETERIHAASRTRLTSVLLELMLAHGAAGKERGTL
jgi:hypothetical protein